MNSGRRGPKRIRGEITFTVCTLCSDLKSAGLAMVGVPGKSKGCATCRRRKIRVSISHLFVDSSSSNVEGSAILMYRSVRNAAKVEEHVKGMSAIPCSSIGLLGD